MLSDAAKMQPVILLHCLSFPINWCNLIFLCHVSVCVSFLWLICHRFFSVFIVVPMAVVVLASLREFDVLWFLSQAFSFWEGGLQLEMKLLISSTSFTALVLIVFITNAPECHEKHFKSLFKIICASIWLLPARRVAAPL